MTALLDLVVEHGPSLFLGVTIVLAGGLLLARWQRTAAARRRAGIWTALAAAIYLGAAATPLPRFTLPSPGAPTPPLDAGPMLPPGVTRGEVLDALGLARTPGADAVRTGAEPAASGVSPAAPRRAGPAAGPAAEPAARPRIDWSTAIAAVYLGCAALLLAHYLLGLARLAAILRRARLAPAATRRLAELPARTRVLIADRPVRPFCAGSLRPVIVLSPGLAERPDLLAAVLRHEAAHLRARDPLVQALFALLALPLVLHPLLWWLRADVRFCSEVLADERAAGTARTDYARELLDLADDRTPPVRAVSTMAIFHRPSDFYRRIQMLLQPVNAPTRPLSRLRRAGQLAAMLTLVTTVAGVLGVPASAQDPSRGRAEALAAERQALRDEIDRLRDEIAALRARIQEDSGRLPAAARALPLPGQPLTAPEPSFPRTLPGYRTDPQAPADPVAQPPTPPPAEVPVLQSIPLLSQHLRTTPPTEPTPATPQVATPAPVMPRATASSPEGIVALASRLLDLDTDVEIARHKLHESERLVKADMVSASELHREKAMLENLERKRHIVRGLVDGEIAATKLEIAWLERQLKRAGKDDRLRAEMELLRAKGRLEALRAAR